MYVFFYRLYKFKMILMIDEPPIHSLDILSVTLLHLQDSTYTIECIALVDYLLVYSEPHQRQ